MSFGISPYKKLCIYYGYPLAVNNVWDIEKAATYFSFFDIVVFGKNLEEPSHEAHNSTKKIISLFHKNKPNGLIFGYLDIGITTSNFSIETLKQKLEKISAMDMDGVLLDNAGYINETPRERLNSVVDFAHNLGLSVMVNAWNPDEVLGDYVNPLFNPNGIESFIGKNDFYLNESFVVNTVAFADRDGFQDNMDIIVKSQKSIKYRIKKGVKILGVGIADFSNLIDKDLEFYYNFVEAMALVYSFDGYGLCDYMYSSKFGTLHFFRPRQIPHNFYSLNPLPEITINESKTEWIRRKNSMSVLVHIDTVKRHYYVGFQLK
ncbi:MAG: hypothetical protein ACP6IS_07365 [Candidatus Asgardarchaeia archaeon]